MSAEDHGTQRRKPRFRVLLVAAIGAGLGVSPCLGDPARETLYPVWIEGRLGYMNRTGALVLEPRFTAGSDFFDGVAIVHLPAVEGEDEPWGILDTRGRLRLQPRYEYNITPLVFGFREGLLGVRYQERWGFIDTAGNMVIQPQFDDVEHFSEGLAAVSTDGKWGYVDRNGSIVVEPRYEDAQPFSGGMAAVQLAGKYGYIDSVGQVVIAPRFDGAAPFSEGLAAVTLGGFPEQSVGFIDASGEMVIAPEFIDAGEFAEGLAPVSVRAEWTQESHWGPWGAIDKNGEMVIVPRFLEIRQFSEGLAWAIPLDGDRIGYIDKKGQWAIEPKFDSGSSFRDGIAEIGFGGCTEPMQLGYITKQGRYLRKPR